MLRISLRTKPENENKIIQFYEGKSQENSEQDSKQFIETLLVVIIINNLGGTISNNDY